MKRRYRDVLIGNRPDVRLVYLKGDETLIARRLATRHDHFMPRDLLHSQFEALEEPGPDENPVVVSIEPQPREIVRRILVALNLLDEVERTSPRSPGGDANASHSCIALSCARSASQEDEQSARHIWVLIRHGLA